MIITLKGIIEPDGSKVEILCEALPTCSPWFAIHRPYSGKGTFDTKMWKLTHIPSGLCAGRGLVGRDARKILRTLSGVLAAWPVDWSKSDFDGSDFAAIPKDIQVWAAKCGSGITT
jgi:hypothetical protein